MSGKSDYLAYMLRLQRVWRDGQPVWLASVESPHTGKRQAFANVEALFAFLGEMLELGAAGDRPRGDRGPPGDCDWEGVRADLTPQEERKERGASQ
jgi:hypothetical protein